MSAVSCVKIDGLEKFKIMVVCLDLAKEKNEKRYQFLLVFYDFENSQVSFFQSIKTFFYSVASVGLTDFSRIFCLVTPRGKGFIRNSLHLVL